MEVGEFPVEGEVGFDVVLIGIGVLVVDVTEVFFGLVYGIFVFFDELVSKGLELDFFLFDPLFVGMVFVGGKDARTCVGPGHCLSAVLVVDAALEFDDLSQGFAAGHEVFDDPGSSGVFDVLVLGEFVSGIVICLFGVPDRDVQGEEHGFLVEHFLAAFDGGGGS